MTATKSTEQHTDKTNNLCTEYLFRIRIWGVMLSLFLLVLSMSYAVGQMLDVKLDILTLCSDSKNITEIWEHSYESGLVNGEVVLSEESQFGWTSESCWTTRSVVQN